MNRTAKEKVVSEFKDIFSNSEIVIAVHYEGLDSVAINSLRKETYDKNVSFKVTKNRLIRLAIEKTPYENMLELFKGPTGIAYSEDVVAASKIIHNFSKQNESLSIIGGALKDKILDISGIKYLASLSSLEEIRAIIIAMLSTPASRIVSVISAPGAQVARVLGAYSVTKLVKEAKTEEKPNEEEKLK